MQSIAFLLVACVLYFVSDAIVQWIERRLGRRLEHRSLLFFALLLGLSLTTFPLIQHLMRA